MFVSGTDYLIHLTTVYATSVECVIKETVEWLCEEVSEDKHKFGVCFYQYFLITINDTFVISSQHPHSLEPRYEPRWSVCLQLQRQAGQPHLRSAD